MHGKNQLKQALDEARLSNEIISAIAKSYCSIYRIDVQKDFFEEVSNDSEIHKLTGNRGCASEKLYQLCDTMVSSEYRSLIRPFLDVSTLSNLHRKKILFSEKAFAYSMKNEAMKRKNGKRRKTQEGLLEALTIYDYIKERDNYNQ